MKHFVLIYDVVKDYAERRTAFRAEHLALAQAAKANGDLFLAGAFANPVDGALLVFQGETGAAAEAFAQADPYVKN
ncbi:MAG: YciI family protein, partial [Betaproteobacteria bacterium]